MSVDVEAPGRTPLSRERVLSAAVAYVDEHGLEALSMHKLGAALGVRAMSLYKYVADKDDLLDGIVETLWTEIPLEPSSDDWRQAIRQFGRALRELVHRHPHAAALLTGRKELQLRPLQICHTHLELMRHTGVPDGCAVPLLRLVITYGIGYALAELSFPTPDPAETCANPEAAPDDVARIRHLTRLLPDNAPDDLIRTALLICGGCDMNAQFNIGLDLMIHGLDTHLNTTTADTARTERTQAEAEG